MRTLAFYFDVISSNAYLAWLRMPELARRFDLAVEPVPVLFAGLLEANGQLGPAEVRPKARWMAINNLRKAAILGVPIKPPIHHPFNPLLALRIASLDLPREDKHALVTALLEATWAEQLHVSEPEVMIEIANGIGLDGKELVATATTGENKLRLRTQTDEAIAAGVFGVPTFGIEGQLFWGYDDLPYLEMFLEGKDPLDPKEAALWGSGPPRPSAMRRSFREQKPKSWQREADSREK
jgi:2-hydroxychromene-2-carboxylate isomerase